MLTQLVDTFSDLADALGHAAASGGGLVEIHGGNMLFEESLYVPSNTRLIGRGARLLQSSPDQQMIVLSGVRNVSLEHLHILGNEGRGPDGRGAVLVEGSAACRLDLLTIEAVGICSIVVRTTSTGILIHSLYSEHAGEEGVYLNGLNCQLAHSFVSGSREAGVKCRGQGCIISGNTFPENGQFGVLLAPPAENCSVIGNIIPDSGFDGIRANGVTGNLIATNHVIGSGRAGEGRANIRVSGRENAIIGNFSRRGGADWDIDIVTADLVRMEGNRIDGAVRYR